MPHGAPPLRPDSGPHGTHTTSRPETMRHQKLAHTSSAGHHTETKTPEQRTNNHVITQKNNMMMRTEKPLCDVKRIRSRRAFSRFSCILQFQEFQIASKVFSGSIQSLTVRVFCLGWSRCPSSALQRVRGEGGLRYRPGDTQQNRNAKMHAVHFRFRTLRPDAHQQEQHKIAHIFEH